MRAVRLANPKSITISETFDGLEETVWVNFASLENPHLFAAPEGAGMVFDGEEEKHGAELHEWLVNEIRTKAEVIPNQPAPGQKRVMLPALKRGQVMYNEPATKFPTLEDLQSRPNLTSWIEGEVGKLGEKKENHLHPRSTHLIFFEDAGFSRGGGQQVSNRPPLVNVFPRPLLIGSEMSVLDHRFRGTLWTGSRRSSRRFRALPRACSS